MTTTTATAGCYELEHLALRVAALDAAVAVESTLPDVPVGVGDDTLAVHLSIFVLTYV